MTCYDGDMNEYKITKSVPIPLDIVQYIDSQRGKEPFSSYVVKILQSHMEVSEQINEEL